MKEANSNQKTLCVHCSLPVPDKLINSQGPSFCCSGCEFVYNTIHKYGLENFYKIKQKTQTEPSEAAPLIKSNYQYMDEELFFNDYVTGSEESQEIIFALEGVHCAACVWIIEKLPNILEGVNFARVDFAKSSCQIGFNKELIKPSIIAKTLHSIGYKPTPSTKEKLNDETLKLDRSLLLKIGVAALCTGNTMNIAIPLYQGIYTGIESEFQNFFHWASLVLSLPCVFYSAIPFYKAALGGLKAKVFHIDLPISIGIQTGFWISVANTIFEKSHVYFDSICMLCFLLLLGRWIHIKIIRKATQKTNISSALLPNTARIKTNSGFDETYIHALKKGDIVKVESNEIIVADGITIEGSSHVNQAILTGESTPIKIEKNSEVFAGTKNLSSTILIKVVKPAKDSRFGQIIKIVTDGTKDKANLINLTDKLGGWFVLTVILLATICFCFWYYSSNLDKAMTTTLAFLVITCPCALGLSAPLAMAVAVSRAAKKGILIKGLDTIERLNQTEMIFFDKTGTLTEGKGKITDYVELNNSSGTAESNQSDKIKSIIAELEQGVKHPIAVCLYNQYKSNIGKPYLRDIEHIAGKGVKGLDTQGNHWKLGSTQFCKIDNKTHLAIVEKLIKKGSSPVVLTKNSTPIAIIGYGDLLKKGCKEAISRFTKKGMKLGILSGDNIKIVKKLAENIGIDNSASYGQKLPEEKSSIISNQTLKTAMIGDGVNDVGALANAYVGIGLRGGAENCLRACDVFISSQKFELIEECFMGADKTIRIIKKNLILSLAYNLIGGGFAICGFVNPLVAAVIMPISSLTVVLSSSLSRSY